MTLLSTQLLEQLSQKQTDFKEFNNAALEVYRQYREALTALSSQSSEQMSQALQSLVAPGARPLEPLGTHSNWCIPSNLQWSNREESLEWVKSQLANITTFAVDGSQIFPNTDLSLPVALVQVGWFSNPSFQRGQL